MRAPLPLIAAAVGTGSGLAAASLGIHPALGFLAGVTVLLLADLLAHL